MTDNIVTEPSKYFPGFEVIYTPQIDIVQLRQTLDFLARENADLVDDDKMVWRSAHHQGMAMAYESVLRMIENII